METSNREWDKPEYHWHTCENCGKQCPHEGVTCRCPWCRWSHSVTKQFDLSGDGDGIRHKKWMDEETCKMAILAGWFRLAMPLGDITYGGEQVGDFAFGRKVGLRLIWPGLEEGMWCLIWDMRGWLWLQGEKPELQALGMPRVYDDEEKAA